MYFSIQLLTRTNVKSNTPQVVKYFLFYLTQTSYIFSCQKVLQLKHGTNQLVIDTELSNLKGHNK